MNLQSLTFLALIMAFGQGAAMAAEVRPWASYAELHGVFAKFNDLPAAARNRILFHVSAKPPAGIVRPDEISLSIASKAGPRPLAIDRDWRLRFPVDNRLLQENPLILTSLERGRTLVLRPQITLVPLPGLVWSLAELARGVDQANAAVRAQAGVFRLFAPRQSQSRCALLSPAPVFASRRLAASECSRPLPMGIWNCRLTGGR